MSLDKYSAVRKDKRCSVMTCGDKAAALTCTPSERRTLIGRSVHSKNGLLYGVLLMISEIKDCKSINDRADV